MRTFKMNKLVRDKIVAQMISRGDSPKYRVLSSEEFIKEIVKKIREEYIRLLKNHRFLKLITGSGTDSTKNIKKSKLSLTKPKFIL